MANQTQGHDMRHEPEYTAYAGRIRYLSGIPGSRPGGKNGGFTLVEVVFSLGILSMAMIALLGLCFNVVTMNHRLEQSVNAMSLVNEQLGELLAAAGSNSAFEETGKSPAKAFLLGMRNKMRWLEHSPRPADFPYNITIDQAAGTLVYEFMVPLSGGRRLAMTDPVADIMENRNPLARGVAVVYLRENAVPQHFLEWAGKGEDGATTPWTKTWFPMEGPDSTGNGNYVPLLTSANPSWETSELQNLPMLLSVRYYDNEDQMNADVLVPPPENATGYGTAAVSASRVFLVASGKFAL